MARLRSEERAYLWIYATTILWCIVYLAIPPAPVLVTFDRPLTIAWPLAGIVGAAIAMTGILARDNLLIERAGVTVLLAAPGTYTLIQAGVAISEHVTLGASNRWHLIIVFTLLFEFFFKRYRRLGRWVREAKNTPLEGD